MLSYIFRRLGQALLVMAAVSLISFSLFNFVGDPVNNMVGQEATREDRIRIRQELGLDDPIITQYTRFMGNALQGDFGLSYRIKRPVSELIKERLPATLELVFVSAIIALLVGITAGYTPASNAMAGCRGVYCRHRWWGCRCRRLSLVSR